MARYSLQLLVTWALMVPPILLLGCAKPPSHTSDAGVVDADQPQPDARVVDGGPPPDGTTLPDAGDPPLIKTAEDLKDPPQVANQPPPVTTEERDLLDLLNTVPQDPNALVMLGRLAWYASLSTADIVSMGQNVTDDPYNFRKHVIYVTARNIDLQIIASEIDSVLDSVVTIAGAARKQAKQREAQRSAKRCALTEFFDGGTPDAETLANLFVPESECSTNAFINALRELRGLRAGLGDRFERTGDQ